MKTILTKQAPAPAGHYAQATVAAGLVFVSGQLPFHPHTLSMPDGLDAQLAQAMSNLEAILVAAGSSLSKLVSVTLYITDVNHWPEVNRKYAEIMGEHKPARTIVPVPALHYGALIEINAVAESEES
jgi:2-iminobutanoate/2-iminopropanoate deaminase